MKKVLMTALTISMIICPSACTNDPTSSEALCHAQELDATATCTEVSTDLQTDTVTTTEVATSTDTSTETVVE